MEERGWVGQMFQLFSPSTLHQKPSIFVAMTLFIIGLTTLFATTLFGCTYPLLVLELYVFRALLSFLSRVLNLKVYNLFIMVCYDTLITCDNCFVTHVILWEFASFFMVSHSKCLSIFIFSKNSPSTHGF